MSQPRSVRSLSSTDLTGLAGGLVALMVVAVFLLVAAFWRSAASNRGRARAAAEQLAASFNQAFQVQASARIGRTSGRLFALTSSAQSASPLSVVTAMASGRYEAPTDCGCSRLVPRYAFYLDPARRQMLIVGDTAGIPARHRVASIALSRAPADTVTQYGSTGHDAGGPWIIFYRILARADGSRVTFGFELPLPALDTAFYAPTLALLARERWGDQPFRDSVLGVQVYYRDSVLYASAPAMAGVASPIERYASGFRFLRTRVTLNAAALTHLIPGGIPDVPRAALLALLGLTALLGITTIAVLRRARALVVMREDFTSAVSHELRTPLTQVLLYAEMLTLERGDAASRRRAGEVIVRETRRLIHLIENVLAFARGRRPGVRLAPAVHDLGALTGSVVADAEALAAKYDATLAAHLDAGIAADVDADAWRQIVLNLLDNALRYGPRGQTVRVHLSAEAGRAVLHVDDEGPGVPAADRTRIWRPYERLPGGDAARSGTGIGLAIVAQMVALLDGEATVGDAPGHGARFSISLPLIAALSRRPSSEPALEARTWPRS